MYALNWRELLEEFCKCKILQSFFLKIIVFMVEIIWTVAGKAVTIFGLFRWAMNRHNRNMVLLVFLVLPICSLFSVPAGRYNHGRVRASLIAYTSRRYLWSEFWSTCFEPYIVSRLRQTRRKWTLLIYNSRGCSLSPEVGVGDWNARKRCVSQRLVGRQYRPNGQSEGV